MTKREFLNAVIDLAASEELTTFAQAEIAKLDKRNATPTKADKERLALNEALKAQIAEVLSDGVVKTAAEIAQQTSATTAKVSSMLTQMSKAGQVTVTKVKAASGKGKINGYALATDEPAEDEPVEDGE